MHLLILEREERESERERERDTSMWEKNISLLPWLGIEPAT